jgi:type I restriction enzyme R subunit
MVALVRAYANISDDLGRAGYSDADIERIKQTIDRYLKLREIIRNAAGEKLDLKAYEADMRHLIDTYIEASEPRTISPFDDMPLLELIVKTGIASAINSLPAGLKGNKEAVAETIENNVRSKIIKEHLNDPAYYAKMSALLDEIIAARKAKAIEYEEYLKQIAELAKRVEMGLAEDTPAELSTPGRRAIYNLLKQQTDLADAHRVAEPPASYGASDRLLMLALKIDETVRHIRPDGWRGVTPKENVIKAALYGILQNPDEVERVFRIIEKQTEY